MAQLFLENPCEIYLRYDKQVANAKSPLSLLTLAAPCDSEMTLEFSGQDLHRVMEQFLDKFADWMEPLYD